MGWGALRGEIIRPSNNLNELEFLNGVGAVDQLRFGKLRFGFYTERSDFMSPSIGRCMQVCQVRYTEWARRDGREAEGGGLLNRYRAKSSIEGSNPSLSARPS